MKFIVSTLGCKVNQYESQAVETLLIERGHERAGNAASCDIHIINTCAVTAESARKSRQAIRKAKSLNPSAKVAVCGCFSQMDPEIIEEMGVDLIYGSGERLRMLEDLERVYIESIRLSRVDDPGRRENFERLPAGRPFGRVRAMLKVEDGCNNFCSYCVIPIARGPVRSLPIKDAVTETERLRDAGCRELVVTGIELSSYGLDLPQSDIGGDGGLAALIEAISDAAPELRIRLGSLDPASVDRELCSRLKDRICPHFHLSLQSGCDDILRRMRRHYSTEDFGRCLDVIRECFPGCAVTADLIVGFPGETPEQHRTTLEFIRQCGFSSMHVFPYSPRPGTPAAEFGGRLDRAEMERRTLEARNAAEEMEDVYLRAQQGRTLTVLFERRKDALSLGRADNYTLVTAAGEFDRGSIHDILITGVSGGVLTGI